MILKKYKNALLGTIKEFDLDPKLFSAEDGLIDTENFFIIRLHNSPLLFAVQPWGIYFDKFGYRHSNFLQGYPLSTRDYSSNFEELHVMFEQWLHSVVIPYLDEINIPDSWQTLEDSFSDTTHGIEAPDDLKPFSEEEKIQLKRSIDELQLSIENNFNLNKKELSAIKKRLKYLSDAIDKHNRFDWKGIAISTAIAISVTLALNPEQTRQLFQLFKEAFENIIYLLP